MATPQIDMAIVNRNTAIHGIHKQIAHAFQCAVLYLYIQANGPVIDFLHYKPLMRGIR